MLALSESLRLSPASTRAAFLAMGVPATVRCGAQAQHGERDIRGLAGCGECCGGTPLGKAPAVEVDIGEVGEGFEAERSRLDA
jgi:hypothetical protein